MGFFYQPSHYKAVRQEEASLALAVFRHTLPINACEMTASFNVDFQWEPMYNTGLGEALNVSFSHCLLT